MISTNHSPKKILARLALIFTTVIWGSSFVIMKDALSEVPPFFTLSIRGVIGTGFFFILLLRDTRKKEDQTAVHKEEQIVLHREESNTDSGLKKILSSAFFPGCVLGILLFLAYGTQTLGLERTTPGKNAFLTAFYCVLVPFLHWILDRKRPAPANLFAAIFCVIGIGFISLQTEISGQIGISTGDALSVLCSFLYAFHIIAINRYSAKLNFLSLFFIQFAMFTFCAAISAVLFESFPTFVSLGTGLRFVYLGIFATGLAFFLQGFGQKYTPPSQSAVILSMEGMTGAIISILAGQEELSVRLIAGFAFVFFGVIISEIFTVKKV